MGNTSPHFFDQIIDQIFCSFFKRKQKCEKSSEHNRYFVPQKVYFLISSEKLVLIFKHLYPSHSCRF